MGPFPGGPPFYGTEGQVPGSINCKTWIIPPLLGKRPRSLLGGGWTGGLRAACESRMEKIDIIIFYFSMLFQFLQWGILWDGAGFAGLFQTPIAAVLFAMEVLVAGELRSEALFPP